MWMGREEENKHRYFIPKALYYIVFCLFVCFFWTSFKQYNKTTFGYIDYRFVDRKLVDLLTYTDNLLL